MFYFIFILQQKKLYLPEFIQVSIHTYNRKNQQLFVISQEYRVKYQMNAPMPWLILALRLGQRHTTAPHMLIAEDQLFPY